MAVKTFATRELARAFAAKMGVSAPRTKVDGVWSVEVTSVLDRVRNNPDAVQRVTAFREKYNLV